MDDLPPSAGTDLLWVLLRAKERGGELFTTEERAVLRKLEALPPLILALWARLARRRHAEHRREDAEPYVTTLIELELLTDDVPWSVRAQRSTVPELRAGAKQLGFSSKGKRADLVLRMLHEEGWSSTEWVALPHRALLRRLDRFAFLQRHPDPSRAVIERLGHVVWPTYPPEASGTWFPDRAALDAWEELADLVDEEPEAPPLSFLLTALRTGAVKAPGRLDLTRPVVRLLFEHARNLERRNDPFAARQIYEQLLPYHPHPVEPILRISRTLEATANPTEAWSFLQQHREQPGPGRLSVQRAGRRIAKIARRGWAPLPPHAPLHERTLRLEPSGRRSGRPTFREGLFVEEAVIDLLKLTGRAALHAEGSLWRHLYGLCLAPDAYFAPVGMLPAPYLSGPLDVGCREFATRRPAEVQSVLDSLIDGEASSLVERTYQEWEGCRLAGVSWTSLEQDLRLIDALGPSLLHHVLSILLERGWSAASGLPDLLILPGPSISLPDALPSRLSSSSVLAELKTPTDSLSDAQMWWINELEPFIRVEVWRIRPVAVGLSPS